jgi:phosphoribosylamine--glycine ligase/phosphoribosylglycinamide formyltransferase/phosphoribosylformylglycinamidine cyclo-ligase
MLVRLKDGDNGPNTGGMGAYCPCPLLTEEQLEFVTEHIIRKTVLGLKKEGVKYVGVLYAGLMITRDGPKVLEFNCRFGDPETQVILPLMESDLFETFQVGT